MVWTILVCALALTAALPALAAGPAPRRAWTIAVRAPAQLDLAVARVRFSLPAGGRRPSLQMALDGPAGLDFVGAAALRRQPAHALVVLVVVVNRRPRGSLAPDLAALRLGARLSRALRAPRTVQQADVYGAPHRPPAGLCATPAAGSLEARDVQLLTAAGSPPPGFGPAATVAQGFDAACGREPNPAFRTSVDPPR